MRFASAWSTTPLVGIDVTSGRRLYEVPPPELRTPSCAVAQRAGAHRASAWTAVDAIGAGASRTGRALGAQGHRRRSGRPPGRPAWLPWAQPGPDASPR